MCSLVNWCLPEEKGKLENRGCMRRKNEADEPRTKKLNGKEKTRDYGDDLS